MAPEPTPAEVAAMRERIIQAEEAERELFAPAPADLAGESGTAEVVDINTVKRACYRGEVGDGELFALLHRDRFKYDHAAGRWYCYCGHSWKEDATGQALAAVEAVADVYSHHAVQAAWRIAQLSKTGATGTDKRIKKEEAFQSALNSKISKLCRLQHRKAVLEFAASGPDSLGITGNEWDQNPWLLGCANGIIDLKDGSFRAGEPGDNILKSSPVEWAGLDAPCPRWTLFLQEIFDGDIGLIDYSQRKAGYCLTGSNKEQVMFILHGRGRNGKTVLVETLQKILGDYSIPISAETLLAQDRTRSAANASPDVTKLKARRLVVASESGKNRKIDEGRVKHLTGDDTLCGRDLYARHEVVFSPTHKIFLLTNDKPRIDADSFALWERLHLIPFSLQFRTNPTAENERLKDPDLPEKLATELPGILAWAVKGCLEWQREGLTPPEAVRLATSEYREGEDYFGEFLKEYTMPMQGGSVKSGDLYALYKAWSEDTGRGCMNLTNFGLKMSNRYPKIQNYKGVFYLGLTLKPEHPE